MSSTPVLTKQDALERMAEREKGKKNYLAFYSSVLQGIVTDNDLMTIPIDDHLVHRGHAVFDTALGMLPIISNGLSLSAVRHGKLYQLDQHLDRFLISAKGCGLWRDDTFPEMFDRERLKSIIIDTVRCGGKRDQVVRYWLGAGTGGLGISITECKEPSFYVLCTAASDLAADLYERGVKVITSSVPPKPAPFSNFKTTNYLPNAMMKTEAESKGKHLQGKATMDSILGAFAGIWINERGCIIESSIANIGFVIGGVLTVPKFEESLAGTTVRRSMHLVETQLNRPVIQRDITLSEAKDAEEVMLFGGAMGVMPVVQWDDVDIGSGIVGPYARKLRSIFLEDLEHGFGDVDQLIAIQGLL